MSNEEIDIAQNYLTVDGKMILHIKPLIMRHSTDALLTVLEYMINEKVSTLKRLLNSDLTSQNIDRTISEWFRLYMARKALTSQGGIDSWTP